MKEDPSATEEDLELKLMEEETQRTEKEGQESKQEEMEMKKKCWTKTIVSLKKTSGGRDGPNGVG